MAEAVEVAVGSVDDFPVGRFRPVEVEGREIHVLRTRDGAFFAVKNTCPHKGAPICMGKVRGTLLPGPPGQIEYGLEERIVACPWHGIEFDLRTGDAIFTDFGKKLVTYPVAVKDNQVVVTLRRRERAA